MSDETATEETFGEVLETHADHTQVQINRTIRLEVFIDEDEEFFDELDAKADSIGESKSGWVTKAQFEEDNDTKLTQHEKDEISERLAAYREDGMPARVMVTQLVTTYHNSVYRTTD